MEVMNAVLPNVPAGTQSSPSAIAGTASSAALGKTASPETASAVGTGIEGVVPGLAINSSAAGLLFGMVLAQMTAGLTQFAAEKKVEPDAQAPETPTTPTQLSPEQIAMLASLAPILVAVPAAPQSIPAATEASATGPNVGRPLSLPAQTSLAVLTATGPATQPGKDLKAGLFQDQMPLTAKTPPGAPQMPLATVAATPAPTIAPMQDQGQVFQRMLNAAPGTGEVKNQNGPAAAVIAGDDSLHAVPTAIAKNDKTSDQLQGSQSPSIIIDATLTSKKEESQQDLSQVGSGESARALELAPAGNGRLPAEFLAASEPSHSAPTDAAAIAPPKAVVMPDAAPSSITPRETIHLQLGPSDLGRLTLQVSVQSQQVLATVGVEHRGLGEFLAASQGVLDDAMRQHGLRLEGLHIESITNSDVLGAGADRPGLLDHGQARQDTSRFERAPLARQVPQSEALSMKDHILEPSSRYRINLFA
jgi:hypothetical protein